MKTFVFVVACLLGFVFMVRYVEKKSCFFPQKKMVVNPAGNGIAVENVSFKTEDHLTLNGWFFNNVSSRVTLLFFHGNAGNISHRLDKVRLFHSLGLNVFIIDYRGYGKSQGVPSEKGIYKDALAAFDYLAKRDDIDTARIVGYGESMGGVAVIDLALHRPLAGLIVDSSFSSAADLARQHYPFVPTFLLATKMDSVSKIKNVRVPKLFIHSKDDEIVPLALAQKLFDAAPYPKEFLEIQGDHNGGYALSRSRYLPGIKDFLKKQGLSP